MDLGLKDKVAIVTGGGSNIGKAISLGFGAEGAKVVIADIDEAQAQKVVSQIKSSKGNSVAIRTDVTKPESVEAMVKVSIANFGTVDILVNNVGWVQHEVFIKKPRAEWEREVNLNLWGVINCSRAVLDTMVAKKSGKIVSKFSDYGLQIGRYVTHCGDDIQLVMTHQHGTDAERVHKLAWDAFKENMEAARKLKLHGAGQDLLATGFSGNVKGMGPGVEEMSFEERDSEIVISQDYNTSADFTNSYHSNMTHNSFNSIHVGSSLNINGCFSVEANNLQGCERINFYFIYAREKRETPLCNRIPNPVSSSCSAKNVLIVHGHDEGKKETVARFVEHLSLHPVILEEQPGTGLTLIEKLERFSDVGFAVVLLTPDDFGYEANLPRNPRHRARQNVIFEWGYFMKQLGRQRTCALYCEGVEIPSDISGVLYIRFDDNGAWRMNLARELRSAGFQVNLSKVI